MSRRHSKLARAAVVVNTEVEVAPPAVETAPETVEVVETAPETVEVVETAPETVEVVETAPAASDISSDEEYAAALEVVFAALADDDDADAVDLTVSPAPALPDSTPRADEPADEPAQPIATVKRGVGTTSGLRKGTPVPEEFESLAVLVLAEFGLPSETPFALTREAQPILKVLFENGAVYDLANRRDGFIRRAGAGQAFEVTTPEKMVEEIAALVEAGIKPLECNWNRNCGLQAAFTATMHAMMHAPAAETGEAAAA